MNILNQLNQIKLLLVSMVLFFSCLLNDTIIKQENKKKKQNISPVQKKNNYKRSIYLSITFTSQS